MGGANYMGGKRNAAKARSRDATGRAQKGFFHRQRLEMLSKGLTSATEVPNLNICVANARGVREDPVQGIALAHARKPDEDSRPGLSSSPQQHSYIPSPTKLASDSSSTGDIPASSRKGPSKVLVALDTCEPTFLRAAMDRILALPDLAGLSSFRKRPNTPTPQSSSPRYTKRVKHEETKKPQTPLPTVAPKTPEKQNRREVPKPPWKSTTQAPHKPSITFKFHSPSPPPPQCDNDWFDPITEWADSELEPLPERGGDQFNGSSSDWDLDFDDSDRSIFLPEYAYNQDYVQSNAHAGLVDYASSPQMRRLQDGNYSTPSDPLDVGQPLSDLEAPPENLHANGKSVDRMSIPCQGVDKRGVEVSIFDTESPWDAIGNILGFSNTEVDSTNYHQEVTRTAEDSPSYDWTTAIDPASSPRSTSSHEGLHHVSKLGSGHVRIETDPGHAFDIMVRSGSPDRRRPDTDPIPQQLQASTRASPASGAGYSMEIDNRLFDSQILGDISYSSEDLGLQTASNGLTRPVDLLLLEPRQALETSFLKTSNTTLLEGDKSEGNQIKSGGIDIERLESQSAVDQLVNHAPALFLDFGDESEEE